MVPRASWAEQKAARIKPADSGVPSSPSPALRWDSPDFSEVVKGLKLASEWEIHHVPSLPPLA